MKSKTVPLATLSLSAILLAAFSLAVWAQTLPLPEPAGQGGNKALMKAWTEKKRRIRDQVLEDLRGQGKLPDNGVVYIEVKTKADPVDPGKVLFRIEDVRILPPEDAPGSSYKSIFRKNAQSQGGPAEKRGIFAPLSSGKSEVEVRSLDIPDGQVVEDYLLIKDGRVVDD